MCGGSIAMSVYVITSRSPSNLSSTLSSAPATTIGPTGTEFPESTGEPKCFDGSHFDGTINDNYPILCDPGLQGIGTDVVDTADSAECIEDCSSYVSGAQGDQCVTVEYDIVGSWSIPPIMNRASPLSSQWKTLASSKAVSAQSLEMEISLHRQQFAINCQTRLLSHSSARSRRR
jgi:hypothetical protein